MMGMQLTGNIDEMNSMIGKIGNEINAVETRLSSFQVELDSIEIKKRTAAGSYFNKLISEQNFNDTLKRLSEEREKVYLCKFDANENIKELKARLLKLSNLRDVQIKAHALEKNLKVAGDDYIRMVDAYVIAIAAHNSTLEQIPPAERTNYNPKLMNVRSMFADMSRIIGFTIEKPLTAQLAVQPTTQNAMMVTYPTVTPSCQQEVPCSHKCTFTTESHFCTDIHCWKVAGQKK